MYYIKRTKYTTKKLKRFVNNAKLLYDTPNLNNKL